MELLYNTLQHGHILQTHCLRCRASSKTEILCGQIGESPLLCRGVFMDLLYECNAMWMHSANTLFLDVGLLQRWTHYVDKLEKVPSFVEVYMSQE